MQFSYFRVTHNFIIKSERILKFTLQRLGGSGDTSTASANSIKIAPHVHDLENVAVSIVNDFVEAIENMIAFSHDNCFQSLRMPPATS